MTDIKKVVGILQFEGDEIQKKVQLYEGKNIIGRDKSICNIFIDYRELSRKHAILQCKKQKLTIKDLASKNGIYINTVRIQASKEYEINPFSDELCISDLNCKIKPNWPCPELLPSYKEEEKDCEEKDEREVESLNLQKQKDDNQSLNEVKTEEEVTKEKKVKEKKKSTQNRKSKSSNKDQQQLEDGKNQIEKDKKKTKKGKKKSNNKQKRAQSNDTLIKKKNKQRKVTKSVENQNRKTENEKNTPSKKKTPIITEDHHYPLRQIIQKRVLLSGFKMSFTPTVKVSFVDFYKEEYDCLVMEKYERTFKLLFSICRGVPVISSNWLIDCEYRRTILPFSKFYLPGPEKQTIIDSVEKVRRGFKVFEDLKFHLFCQKYHLDSDLIVDLIEEGGGTVSTTINKKEKQVKNLIFLFPNEYKNEDVKQAQRIGEKKNIFTIQLILDACLRQNINWSGYRIKTI